MLTKREIERIRGELMARGWSVQRLAEHLGVGRSAIYQIISGDSVSLRIQVQIRDIIGRWPWERQPGEPPKRA